MFTIITHGSNPRDLYDPIIPESLYNQCIEYCDHAQWTPNVIKDLPDIHRLVVTYIIRFLQVLNILQKRLLH